MFSERLSDARPATVGTPWRRGLDVFDDYAGGGVLSEELADDLVNDLAGLAGGPRRRRACRPVHADAHPGPPPRRRAVGAPVGRPRLTVVRGGAVGD